MQSGAGYSGEAQFGRPTAIAGVVGTPNIVLSLLFIEAYSLMHNRVPASAV
jgi:hypothetical protein